MSDSGEGYMAAYAKQIVGNALKGPKTIIANYQDNKPVSKMEMAKILSDLKAVGANKGSSQGVNGEYSNVYREEDIYKEYNENQQENSELSETTDYDVQCGNSEAMKDQQVDFELTNEQLTQAIIYSEILGKPRCKTRRRG